jgi:hypothetical protein
MADYYPLIARAVAGLPQNTDEARRALYDRARNALVTQLHGKELSEPNIAHEQRTLEEAIRKVEMEVGGQSKSAAEEVNVRCRVCGHSNTISRHTPAFGTALICARCSKPLGLRVSNPREHPYTTSFDVQLWFGYKACSLLHARCPHCSETNYSIVIPEQAYNVPFYWNRKQENPNAAFVVNAACQHCKKAFVIEWDVDPR